MSRAAADVVSIAAAAWQRLGLPAPQDEGDVEAVAADDEADNDGAFASALRDALAVAGFAAVREAVLAAQTSTVEAP